MIVEKIPFINKFSRDNIILLGGLVLLVMGIIILIVGKIFALGSAIIMLAAGVACLIYLLIPSMQERVRKYLPVTAGGLGSIIGIVTFINSFYLYQFTVGSPLLGQVIILISIAASLLVFDAGLNILGIGIPKEEPKAPSSSAAVSESTPSENE